MSERFRRWIVRIVKDERGVGPLAILLIAALLTAGVIAGMEHEAISDYFGWGSRRDVVMEKGACTPAPYHSSVAPLAGFDEDAGNAGNQYWFMINPSVSFEVSEMRFEWRKTSTTTVSLEVEIWSISDQATVFCPVSRVAYGAGSVEVKNAWTWLSVQFSETGILTAGEWYGVKVQKSDIIFSWKRYTDSATGKARYHYASNNPLCGDGWGWSLPVAEWDYAVVFVGCHVGDARVTTVPAYFSTYNEVVLQGMINSVGPNLASGVYPQFEWGFASGSLSEVYRSSGAVKRGNEPFEMRLSGLPLDETIYYRAGIYGIDSMIETWGSELSFSIPGTEGAMLELEVVENNENRVVFECQVNALGGAESPDLKLFYGETMAEMLSGNYSVTVSSALSGTGRWSYTDSWSVFEDGKEYYVRSGLVVGGEATAHSDVLRFHRYDTTQPGAINWLANLLGIGLDWLWWLILIAGLVFVWTFAMTGGRSSPVLGVVGSFVVLGFSIAFGFVNAWVVVLMAILAGWVIFKIIFKHSGGTG